MTVLSCVSVLDVISIEDDEEIVFHNNVIHPNRLLIDFYNGSIATIRKGDISVTLSALGRIHFKYAKKSFFNFSYTDEFKSDSFSTKSDINTQAIFFANDSFVYNFKKTYDIVYLGKKIFDWGCFQFDDNKTSYSFTLSLREYLETDNVLDAINETLQTLRLIHNGKIPFNKI